MKLFFFIAFSLPLFAQEVAPISNQMCYELKNEHQHGDQHDHFCITPIASTTDHSAPLKYSLTLETTKDEITTTYLSLPKMALIGHGTKDHFYLEFEVKGDCCGGFFKDIKVLVEPTIADAQADGKACTTGTIFISSYHHADIEEKLKNGSSLEGIIQYPYTCIHK